MRRAWQWGAPIAGFAVIPLLVFAWLSIPDRSAAYLALTAVSAIAILLTAAAALAGGLVTDRSLSTRLWMRCALWLIPAIIVTALILSFSAGWLRFVAVLVSVILGAATLPWVAGHRSVRKSAIDWKYLLVATVIGMAGLYLPYFLIWWVPGFASPLAQVGSAAARFLLAYLIAVSAWLAIAATVRRRLAIPAATNA